MYLHPFTEAGGGVSITLHTMLLHNFSTDISRESKAKAFSKQAVVYYYF